MNIGQDRLDLGEVNLLPIKIDLNYEERKLDHLFPPPWIPGFNFTPSFMTFLPPPTKAMQRGREMDVVLSL